MKHERNALQEHVFPKLEQLCQENGFQFQAIDLRWGVSTEAGLDHRAMRICFEELRRSQEISPEPNFLVLLGNRYGWRPLPEEISQAEFDRLAVAAESGGEGGSPITGTHGKTARQVLGDWYRCDENVALPDPQETDPDRVPLNYILQARTQDLGDGRDYSRTKENPPRDTQDWLDVQQVLWRIINTAFPAESLEHRFEGIDWAQHVAEVNDAGRPKRAAPQHVRFQASATEQEIWCGALSATNAERHVIACFREIANRDVFTAGEAKDFFDLTDSGEFDHVATARQTALKTAIRRRLGRNEPLRIPFSRLKRENGKILLDASEADTKAFCDAVFERFRLIIEQQFEEYWNKSKQGSPERAVRELKIEQDEHRRFGRERGGKESFVGRKAELDAIRVYLQNASRQPLVVHGSSGCGKTALMWRAFEEIPEAQRPLIRLIGTTPHASDLRGLLTSLCQELRQQNPREDALPADVKELRDEFDLHLRAATPEQPLILFLDALDQLGDADNGHLLNWLPLGSLPPHVKLVVSCLSDRAKDDSAGQPWNELQKRQLPAENVINLDELSEAEAKTLFFDRWLHQAGRTVGREQRKMLEQRLTVPACRQPIYLKLLFEEARLWQSYDAPPRLGENVPALLKQLFDRLSLETNHGPLLVNRVLGYLSASRYGLAENEILEILFADSEYKEALDDATKATCHELPPKAKRIPIALWSRLRYDLAPYLTERAAPGANVLTFYHRQVREWVREHFEKSSALSWQPQQRLVGYFNNRADPLRDGSFGDDRRALAELLFHLVSSGENERAQMLLGDMRYLDARCSTGSAVELLDDYGLLTSIDNPSTQCFRAFILLHAQSLAKYPESFFSLVHHDGSPLARQQADALLSRALWKKPWLRTVRIELPCPPSAAGRQAFMSPLRRCEFERSCAVGFARGAMIVFRVKKLGEIVLFDLNRLIELPQRISIRPLRPLALSASDDARHLAIVYDNGELEVIKLHWSATGTLLAEEGVAIFRYLLPEMDPPVMAWNGNELVYQEDAQNMVCAAFDAPAPASRRFRLPDTACGELTGVAFVGSRMVASFRAGTSGAVVCFGASAIEGVQHFQGTQALHVCPCGSSLVTVAWSDHRLCRYDTNRHLHPVDDVFVKDQPIKLAWANGLFVWCTYSAELHAWDPGEGPPKSSRLAGVSVASGGRVESWQTQALPDGSLVTITDVGATIFRISYGEAATPAQIYTVFEPIEGQILAIQKREDGAWLVDLKRRRETLLTKEQGLNRGRDVDGRHLLLNTVANVGVRMELETQSLQEYNNLPAGIDAVAGDPNGGFWLADRMGQILRFTEDGQGRVVAEIPLRCVSGPSLLCTQRFLIWAGTCVSHQESGEDMAYAFFFFLRTPAGLRLLGKRIVKLCEGRVEAFDYSDALNLLLVAVCNSGHIAYGFRKGSIDQYLQGEELLFSRPQTLKEVKHLRFSGDGATVQLLGGDGVFMVMDPDNFRVAGVLKPAMPFTGMTRGPSDAPRSLIVAAQTTLFSYTLERIP